jgi:hypothetical protein
VALQRIRATNKAGSPYLASKIGPEPKALLPESFEVRHYEIRYREFYSALSRTYAENSYVIRVPFFGITVDANDLGLLGGISFVVILVVLRFCISREIGNLKVSFREADRLGRLREFYRLLAMQQVFTVPEGTETRRDPLLLWVPKLFFLAPFVVHASVVGHDFLTSGIGRDLNDTHATVILACELMLALLIAVLTRMVLKRLKRVDNLWLDTWRELNLREARGSSTDA